MIAAGRQHDRHRLAGLQPAFPQSGGYCPRALAQPGIAERGVNPVVIAVDLDRQPVGMRFDMPVEHFNQGFGAIRDARRWRFRRWRLPVGCQRRRFRPTAGLQDQINQIARRFGQQNLFAQLHLELVLNPAQQFGAGQTVQRQIPIHMAVQGQRRCAPL